MGGNGSTLNEATATDSDSETEGEAKRDTDMEMQIQQLWKDRLDGVLTDIELLCKDSSGSVKAHRNILFSASTVFREIILGNTPSTLQLPDFKTEEISPFLEYIYTKSTSQFNSSELIIHGLYAAEKYNVAGLTTTLKKSLENNLRNYSDDENGALSTAVEIVNMRKRLPELHEQHFVPLAHQMIILRLENLLESGKLTFDILETSLSAESLKYRPLELSIFRVVNSWAEHYCELKGVTACGKNKRDALGSIIKCLYFMDISDDAISTEVLKSDLLSREDISSIMLHRHNNSIELHLPSGERAGMCLQPDEMENQTLQALAGPGGILGMKSEHDMEQSSQSLPDSQKKLVDKFINKTKIEDEEWFIIPKDWFNRWESWVGNSRSPGRINLHDFRHEETRNALPVPREVWNLFSNWFGVDGQAIPRKVISISGKLDVEVVLWRLHVFKVITEKMINPPEILQLSRSSSFHQVKQIIRNRFQLPSSSKMRFWIAKRKDTKYKILCVHNTCELRVRIDSPCKCKPRHELVDGGYLAYEMVNADGTWTLHEDVEYSVPIHCF